MHRLSRFLADLELDAPDVVGNAAPQRAEPGLAAGLGDLGRLVKNAKDLRRRRRPPDHRRGQPGDCVAIRTRRKTVGCPLSIRRPPCYLNGEVLNRSSLEPLEPMTPDEIKELVESVRDGLTFPVWSYYLLMLVAGAIGSYFGAYLRRRAEDKATNANFATLLEQQKAVVHATEGVRADLSRLSDEHRVRFSQLHAKVFESVAQLYCLLVRADLSLHAYITSRVASQVRERTASEKEQLGQTSEALNELSHFFHEHEIFFQDNVVDPMKELLAEYKFVFNAIWGSEVNTNEDSVDRAIISAMSSMVERVNPIKSRLKHDFQMAVGISNQDNSNNAD